MKEIVLKELQKATKDYEVYLQTTEINEVHIQKNRINFINKTFDSGYGIRVLTKGLGFSSSNVNSTQAVRKTISDALKSSRMIEKVKFQFPSQKPFSRVKNIDKKIKNNGEGAVRDYVAQLLNSIPSDILLSFGKVRSYDSHVQIINSEGLDLEREETNFMLELSIIIKKNGKKVEFWPHEYRRRIEDLPVSNIQEWIRIAQDQLIAKQPRTERTTVIFSPSTVLDGLGSVLGFHATGAAKVNDVSKFLIGDRIASEDLTIISDGLYPFGLMTSGFDDEGVPQRRIPLIEKGEFKNFVYDQFYGLKDETESTGNGLRQSDVFYIFDSKFASTPGNQVSNFYVEPGNKSFDELIEEVKHGVLVKSFSWLNPDATTGKFSSEIRAGYYIENGELASPIKGGLVAGDFFELIKNISGISNESTICSGGTILAGVCPYIRFDNVQVAGR